MKKSYKRLIIFQVLMLLLIILNSFISNILTEYKFIILLIVMLVCFKFLLGFENKNYRHTKDMFFEIIIFLIIFFILYYLFGIFIGFAKTENYYSFNGFKTFIVPTILTIILKEILRYNMLKKSEENKIFLIVTCVLFILLDISNPLYYANFSTSYDSFIFVSLTLLPAISTNILCSYLSLKAGYKPVLLYLLVIELYQYLLPIVPNPNEYLSSIIQLIVPAILCYRLYNFFKKNNDEYKQREYNKKNYLFLIIPIIVIVVSVYFTSGYFKYYAVAIATGSMHPTIKKGDVVVIEKLDKYDRLKEGQVLAFKYSDVLIVHRIIRIVEKNGTYYFYTKGDANNGEDGYPVTEDMIMGKIDLKIPFLGLPTVWLKEL